MSGWIVSIILLGCLVGLHLFWQNRCRSIALGQAEATGREAGLAKAVDMAGMFANMPEGVLVTDAEGRIEFANQAFCRLFDLQENPSGKTVMEAIRIHQANDLIERLKVESSIKQEEFMLPDLEQRFLQANGVAIREKDGVHRGTILMFHDLTRMKRLENLRQEFVANVSHELRTPLSIIKGYVETLLDAEEDAESINHRFLKKVEKHSDRLTFLIEDILTLSRMESGESELDLKAVSYTHLTLPTKA